MVEFIKVLGAKNGRTAQVVPGVIVSVGVVVLATLPLHFFPAIGLAAMSIVTGAIVAPIVTKVPIFGKGIDFSSKYLLQLSVVMSGFSIDFNQISSTAKSSFVAIVTSVSVALVAGFFLARWWKIDRKVASLISVGTAICGASAIAAVSGPLGVDEDERKISTSTIFTFNLAALFIFPVVGHLLHMTQHQFGVMAGGAVNDLSSVVATSHMYGSVAQSTAIVVKLTRSIAIVPIVVAITIYETIRRSDRQATNIPLLVAKAMPKFIVLFILAALVGNLTAHFAAKVLSSVSTYAMEVALAGIGLSVAKVRGAKVSMLFFGAALWVIVTLATVANIKL